MKQIPKQWRQPISFVCMAVIGGSINCFSHTARLPHLLAASAFFVLAFLSGDLRRLFLGLSLCLVNIVLVFVRVAWLTELSVYLIALALGIFITMADNRREHRKQLTEPKQPAT